VRTTVRSRLGINQERGLGASNEYLEEEKNLGGWKADNFSVQETRGTFGMETVDETTPGRGRVARGVVEKTGFGSSECDWVGGRECGASEAASMGNDNRRRGQSIALEEVCFNLGREAATIFGEIVPRKTHESWATP